MKFFLNTEVPIRQALFQIETSS